MIETLIDKYKGLRKRSALKSKQFQYNYAFVGVGQHSLSNLYPVIDYLGVPLKYIFSRTKENADLLAIKYGATGTDNLSHILSDPDIKGVFVCSHPNSHFEICKQVLASSKHLFVEKPPCLDSASLSDLVESQKSAITQIGLQKRYAKVYSLLKSKLKSPEHYSLRFCTGAYPEGDEWMDLFIHPLDLANFLFGTATVKNATHTKNKLTCLLTLEHENGVIGQLELSTDYSWTSPVEELRVIDTNGNYFSSGVNYLEFSKRGKSIAGIPLEKVISRNNQREILIDNNGFVPVAELNSLSVQGYYQEIKDFLDVVEGRSNKKLTSLEDLIPTFELLKNIKSSL